MTKVMMEEGLKEKLEEKGYCLSTNEYGDIELRDLYYEAVDCEIIQLDEIAVVTTVEDCVFESKLIVMYYYEAKEKELLRIMTGEKVIEILL